MNDSLRQLLRTLVGPLMLFAMLASAPAQAATLSLLAGTLAEGDQNIGYPLNLDLFKQAPMRYQQVYSTGVFQGLSGAFDITAIAFRTDGLVGNRFSTVLQNVRIDLSTTSRVEGGLDMVYESNVGADRRTVFSGALSVTSAAAVTAAGSRALDVVINFSSPFRFHAGSGSLLLDIFNYGGGLTSQLDAIGAAGDGMSRLFGAVGAVAATKQDSTGLVTQFTMTAVTVPVPPAIYLLLSAVAGLLLMVPRRRSVTVRG
jgi:hypothetical protein